jgi:hypothetical protein
VVYSSQDFSIAQKHKKRLYMCSLLKLWRTKPGTLESASTLDLTLPWQGETEAEAVVTLLDECWRKRMK